MSRNAECPGRKGSAGKVPPPRVSRRLRGLPPSSPFFSKRSELIGLLSPARRRCVQEACPDPLKRSPSPSARAAWSALCAGLAPRARGCWCAPDPRWAAAVSAPPTALRAPPGPPLRLCWLLFLAVASPTQVTGAPRWALGLVSELCSLLPRPCPSPYFKHLQVTPSFWKSTRPLSRAPISRFPDSCSHTGNRVGLADLQDKAIVGSTEGALL